MPLPMVHLGVAKNMVEILNIKDTENFYLGSIAPDAVHMRNKYNPEDKKKSHMRNENKELWKSNVVNYVECHMNKDDFLTGYGIHILTDILWAETVYSSFKLKYSKDTSPIQDERWAYYNDTDKLDFELYNKLSYAKELWEQLSKSRAVDVTGLVLSNEINAWNDRTLHWFDCGESQHKNPIRYITYRELVDFIQTTTTKIQGFINLVK